MKSLEISAEKRSAVGKRATRLLRKEGKVPCVIYGGKENIHFSAPVKSFRPLIYTPNSYMVDLIIDGVKILAVIKDVQYHPVSDEIYHIDFLEVSSDKPVSVYLPVKLTGFAKGVKEGGKLRHDMRKVKVKAFVKDLPEQIEIAIDDLRVGQSIKIKDLVFENLEFLDAKSNVVAMVALTRVVSLDEEATVGEGEEGEEGEAKAEEGTEAAEK